MRQLDLEIKTNGTAYTQIKRDSFRAIYKSKENNYEVFRVDVAAPTEIFGVEYPEREVYPSTESFGSSAWCVRTLEKAEDYYNNIEPKE